MKHYEVGTQISLFFFFFFKPFSVFSFQKTQVLYLTLMLQHPISSKC